MAQNIGVKISASVSGVARGLLDTLLRGGVLSLRALSGSGERSLPQRDFRSASPLSEVPVSRPVGMPSEPPELHFKRVLAKTVICSTAQLISAAADFNPAGLLAHRVQFGT